MTPETVIDIFRYGMVVVIMMVSTIVIPGLLIGLVISVFQAATQINEQTLSFVPRLIITMGGLIISGPWLLKLMLEFTEQLVNNITTYIG